MLMSQLTKYLMNTRNHKHEEILYVHQIFGVHYGKFLIYFNER